MPLDPTPGYAEPLYFLTFQQRLSLWIAAILQSIRSNPILYSLAVLLIGFVIWNRFYFYDLAWTYHCKTKLLFNSRDRILSVARLLEYRSGLTGNNRRKDRSLAAFLLNDFSLAFPQSDFETFCMQLNKTLYAPKKSIGSRQSIETHRPGTAEATAKLLFQIVNQCTYSAILKKNKAESLRNKGN